MYFSLPDKEFLAVESHTAFLDTVGIILVPSDFLSPLMQVPRPRFLYFSFLGGGGRQRIIMVTNGGAATSPR